jgi:hypothetical protein
MTTEELFSKWLAENLPETQAGRDVFFQRVHLMMAVAASPTLSPSEEETNKTSSINPASESSPNPS